MTRLAFSDAGKAQLLAAIAAAPAGRLSIPKLRDALVSQADVLDALKALVDDGTLDRATLRPVKRDTQGVPGTARKAPGASSSGDALRDTVSAPATTPPAEDVPSPPAADPLKVSGAELVARFEAALAADPMISRSRFGVALNGSTSALAQLRRTLSVQPKTIAKFEALLADPPRRTRRPVGDPAPRKPSPPKPRRAGPPKGASSVTGAELVARFDALAANDPTLSRSAFGRAFNGAGGALTKLAKSKWVAPATVEKFEALLADPPRRSAIGETRKRRKAEREAKVAPRLSGTARAPRAADKSLAATDRRIAAANRTNTEHAAALIAQHGEDAGRHAPNQAIGSAIRTLQFTRAAEARAEDPVEQAKLILRRRNRVVYDAPVAGGPEGKFVCSGLPPFVTREQLIAEAEKVSGQTLTGEAA